MNTFLIAILHIILFNCLSVDKGSAKVTGLEAMKGGKTPCTSHKKFIKPFIHIEQVGKSLRVRNEVVHSQSSVSQAIADEIAILAENSVDTLEEVASSCNGI